MDARPNAGWSARSSRHLAQLRQHTIRNTRCGADRVSRVERIAGILAKAEYVDQKYFGYPTTNIKNGGKFHGVMLEGVVAF